jgi:hypothetical protein
MDEQRDDSGETGTGTGDGGRQLGGPGGPNSVANPRRIRL